MANATPSPPPSSPHDEVENDDQQPVISSSPPRGSVPSQSLPIEEVDGHHYQQLINSNSTNSPHLTSVQPPENAVDRQQQPLSEDVEDEQEPPVSPSPPLQEDILDRQQTFPPSSPLLPPPPTGVEHQPENTGPVSPDHDSPHSKQSPPTEHEDPVESPNPNPNSDHESLSPSSPTTLEGNPSPKAQQSPQNPSPSTPLTAGSPSSPPAPPLGVPLLLQMVATSSLSKPQASPWTHQETANLIQAYQEKWYSLKKGPLKAGQWEEVAITVAARCGYDEPTKTAKQCRHKIEKLRKRYRAERGKPRSKAAAWNFFKLMDNLEKGPLPISSSQPAALVVYQEPSNSNGKRRKNDESDDEFLLNKRNTRSTSSDHQIFNGSLSGNLQFADGGTQRVMRRLRTPVFHKNKGFYQEEEEDEAEAEGEGAASQLAAEIKGFAEKFVKMENKKMEMIKDVERYRLEMENKRMEMILESQQMLVETVNKAFSSSQKTHKLSAK